MFFRKKGWTNVLIYGAGTLGELLYEEIHNDVTVVAVVDRAADLRCLAPYDVPIVSPEKVGSFGEADVIVVTPYFSLGEIVSALRKYTQTPIVSIVDIISEMKSDQVSGHLLASLDADTPTDCPANRAPNDVCADLSELLTQASAQLHAFPRPTAKAVKNPTQWEMFSASANMMIRWPESEKYRVFCLLCSDIERWTTEYYRCLTAEDVVIKYENGIYVYGDIRNEFVNYLNGYRYIPARERGTYKKTLHLVGNCQCRGAYVDDVHAISNILQTKLNATRDFGVRCYALGVENLETLLSVLNKADLKSGDVVVTIMDSNFLPKLPNFNTCKWPNIFFHDLQRAFDRPHGMGEVFLDNLHVCHRGYALAADFIYSAVFERVDSSDGNIFARLSRDKSAELHNSEPLSLKTVTTQTIPHLAEYVKFLKANKVSDEGKVGAVVMNCNPFTLGHMYLAERAAEQVDRLYIFVVEEDKSLFPFADRIELVKRGVAHLKNVTVLRSGQCIISTVTFPGYFKKEDRPDVSIDAAYDVRMFASEIAPILNISVRFAGSEPFDPVTSFYNDTMRDILPSYGVDFVEIKRLEMSGCPVSASNVRALLQDGKLGEVRGLVPESTYEYLEKRGRTIGTAHS
ncbi:MAG: adenylyltransferase/cytidyltransferase family protein [Synergistaceae bacterium]|nr:adenylyltransferase/cytidyltransferase family protein [Synergistaceae bacterium]